MPRITLFVFCSCLLVLMMMISGCDLLGIGSDAKLYDMTPGMSRQMDKLECWLSIEFKKYPEDIDTQDVKVVFSSIALLNDETFDWAYIAAQDVVAKGLGKGYGPNENSNVGSAPPLKEEIKVKYPLRARPKLDLDITETIWLTVELYWGGQKQAQIEKSIEHVYYRTLE